MKYNDYRSGATSVRTSTEARLRLTEMAKEDGLSIAALVHKLAMAEYKRRHPAEWTTAPDAHLEAQYEARTDIGGNE